MFHLSVKTISRAKGRSAVAAAAYRSGSKIIDDRTAEIHDFTRKLGVEHVEIVLPPGAPFWASDRTKLWNTAELAEKRINSTVAREFEAGIPKDLSYEQGVQLVKDFVAQLVEKHGFAADIAIHKDDPYKWDGTEKGFQGFHTHVLCTTRRLTPIGFGEKTRELDGMQAGRESIELWRERWAITANKHLEMAGKMQRIDHRSLKDQGIDKEPTLHLGHTATTLERQGMQTTIGDVNRRIEEAFRQGVVDMAARETAKRKIVVLDKCIRRALQIRDENNLRRVEQFKNAVQVDDTNIVGIQIIDERPPYELDKNSDGGSVGMVKEKRNWGGNKALRQLLIEQGMKSMGSRGILDDYDCNEPDAPEIDQLITKGPSL